MKRFKIFFTFLITILSLFLFVSPVFAAESELEDQIKEEIEENDYNLNIPRYVDTFEEEEPIDFDEVVKELKRINDEMKEVDAEIKKYFLGNIFHNSDYYLLYMVWFCVKAFGA